MRVLSLGRSRTVSVERDGRPGTVAASVDDPDQRPALSPHSSLIPAARTTAAYRCASLLQNAVKCSTESPTGSS